VEFDRAKGLSEDRSMGRHRRFSFEFKRFWSGLG
jgi:hypothetical protein